MDVGAVNARLLARDTVLPASEPSLKRCTKKFLAFQSDSAEDATATLNTFSSELALFELEASKAEAIRKACEQEIEHYAKLDQAIGQQGKETAADIEALKDELKQARTTRMHKEESEALAKVVNELPQRLATERELVQVDAQVGELTTTHKQTLEELSLRQKQFKLLMQSIFELQRALDPDLTYDDKDQDEEADADADNTGDSKATSSGDVEMAVA